MGTPVIPMSIPTSLPFKPQPKPPEKRELPAATLWISRHPTPASFNASSIASRHIRLSGFSSNFPHGCMPTPMTATSLICLLLFQPTLDRPELPRDHFVTVLIVVQRLQHQLHLRTDLQVFGLGRAHHGENA